MAKEDMLVGFIGLGTMGGKMAANLQKAGYKLVVHDLTRQAASHHLNAGAVWAETPRALAEQCDVMFTSLPEPADVEAVALGRRRPARRHAQGCGVVRPVDQFAERGEEAQRGVRRKRRAHARRAR